MAKLTKSQVEALILQTAQQYRLDTKYVPYLTETVMGESGGNTEIPGDNNQSFGLWQMYFGGGLGNALNLTVEDAKDPVISTRAAIGHIVDSMNKGSSFDSVMRQNWSAYRNLYKSDPTETTGPAGLQDNYLSKALELADIPYLREAIRLRDEHDALEPDYGPTDEGSTAWNTWKSKSLALNRKVDEAIKLSQVDPQIKLRTAAAEELIKIGLSDEEANKLAKQLTKENIQATRAAQDRAATTQNIANQQQFNIDQITRWEKENKRHLDAMDKAKNVYDTIFPYMTSRTEAFLPESLDTGGAMNQLFDRLGLNYTPPAKLQPQTMDLGAVYQRALEAGGPIPELTAPEHIPTMTEQFGPLSEFPEADSRTPGQILDDILNGLLGPPSKPSSPVTADVGRTPKATDVGGILNPIAQPIGLDIDGNPIYSPPMGAPIDNPIVPTSTTNLNPSRSFLGGPTFKGLGTSLLNFLRRDIPPAGKPLGAFGGGYNPFTEEQSQVFPWRGSQ